ncbi:MAG: hypothetical protein ACI90V_010588 [Bacillariaceae sp.]|jgi:hypothetical protein
MGQIDRNDILSSHLRGIRSKKKSCTPPVYNRNDLSRLFSAKNRFQISSGSSRFLIPSSLLNNSKIVDVQKDEMKLTKKTKTENENINEMSEKQEYSNTSSSMRSGVYFNNCEIFNEMHPSQVHYKFRHVTKAANLPIGKPLARPPYLGVTKPRCAALFIDSNSSAEDEPESKKVDGSRKRDRGQKSSSNTEGGEEENLEDNDPSKRCRMDSTRPSNKKKLSGEEKLFLEAALALSVSKLSATTTTTTKENKILPAPQNNRRSVSPTPPSGQQAMMPPPPFSFFQANSSKRVLLSLGQQQ